MPIEGVEDVSDERKEFPQVHSIAFTHNGDRLILGNNRGMVIVYETVTLKRLFSLRVNAGTTIKSIHTNLNGSILEDGDGGFFLEPLMKFLDSVDQNRWADCTFNHNGKLIVGGSGSKHEHKIYIWDKETGSLMKILEGPRQGLVDIAWHPKKSSLASVSSFGVINIWSDSVEENWSAFAPDFKELEENVEYEEKEYEFDYIEENAKGSIYLQSTAPCSADDINIDEMSDLDGDDVFIPVSVDETTETAQGGSA
ncbi:quinon protein alcohol dehydrogenase-like superfamily [Chytridium lagenaria]|nr:quinon protein alcohol dehydrogenase-like superfamily [Chytridium lagenaria]